MTHHVTEPEPNRIVIILDPRDALNLNLRQRDRQRAIGRAHTIIDVIGE